MDLKVRERESEAMRPHVRAVGETSLLLFSFSPKSQPSEQGAELIALLSVTKRLGASVARAGVRMVTFWVEPAAPSPGPARAAPAA